MASPAAFPKWNEQCRFDLRDLLIKYYLLLKHIFTEYHNIPVKIGALLLPIKQTVFSEYTLPVLGWGMHVTADRTQILFVSSSLRGLGDTAEFR